MAVGKRHNGGVSRQTGLLRAPSTTLPPRISRSTPMALGVCQPAGPADARSGEADVGRAFQDLSISYRPVELRGRIDEAHRQGRPVRIEHQAYHRPPADPIRLTIDVAPLATREGQVIATLLTFTDTTRTFRLQQELEAAQESLETTIEELQSANEALETTNEESGQSTNEELETTNEELQPPTRSWRPPTRSCVPPTSSWSTPTMSGAGSRMRRIRIGNMPRRSCAAPAPASSCWTAIRWFARGTAGARMSGVRARRRRWTGSWPKWTSVCRFNGSSLPDQCHSRWRDGRYEGGRGRVPRTADPLQRSGIAAALRRPHLARRRAVRRRGRRSGTEGEAYWLRTPSSMDGPGRPSSASEPAPKRTWGARLRRP